MNDKLRQLLTIIIALPICLAVGASLILLILQMEGAMRIWGFLALFAFSFVLLILNAAKNRKASRLVESLLDILQKEVHPEKFIAESEKALKTAKNRALRSTLSLNRAVGYEAIGDYETAIRIMKEIPIGTADKMSKAMFYNNAAMFYAEKGAVNEALEAYVMGQPHFMKAGKDIPIAYLTLTKGLLAFVEEKYEEAIELFENARSKGFDDRHSLTKLQLFHGKALAAQGHTKEAKSMFSKVLQKKTYPFLLESARKEMEKLAKTE